MPPKRFYERLGKSMQGSRKVAIAIGLNKDNIYVKETSHAGSKMTDVSDSFKRAAVQFASEEHTFEVDGMKFKIQCERID